mmetsp:Transcript_1753/g.3903  ORF Transcript_1753/g.3903 Transcript_1753/m.3903 type:complete len:601 (+) Transcript_1753:230-2032(+)|eukprot:CAMPEP_0206434680 /NCGR_PEP_ID=MMETSP0324_2-20121206/9338_1 /ASSEMBLY_ACC=CAM_ASM_000836 /TAXON_ID=2866 /ORGANISM="Crypthecodinium cohnii, Strain Seligo" /LENGTH=600 /DNA_ID=CAMNT_0053901313 /DNA_START=230 /DNA_END=2032 /DNA_ORIENTATION=+
MSAGQKALRTAGCLIRGTVAAADRVATSNRMASAMVGSQRSQRKGTNNAPPYSLFGGAALAASGLILLQQPLYCDSSKEDKKKKAAKLAPGAKDNEKVIAFSEVKKHDSTDKGVWVTYREGVYDITEFIKLHPGGLERIMKAAGGQIDPFWAMYAQHNVQSVKDVLAEYRIGRLSEKEYSSLPPPFDPYQTDPKRDPRLLVQAAKPFNAETPLSILAEQEFLTPNEVFFVRHHLPVPTIDVEKYVLEIEPGDGKPTVKLTLKDLQDEKRFRRKKVAAVMQCSGNRREDLNALAQVEGLTWLTGAISNAEWEGVSLRDVLTYAGVAPEAGLVSEEAGGEDDQLHLQMEGLDRPRVGDWKDTKGFYGASVPLAWAQDPRRDCVLAFAMNGEPLPLDHGAPVRCVIPGTAGARSVKWLSKLIVASGESQSHWQQNDYKAFHCSVTWDDADFSSLPAIQDMPVNSAISSPAPKEQVALSPTNTVQLKGWAFSGGGRGIARVEVSADGKTWTSAELQRPENQALERTWAWTFWTAELPVPKDLAIPGKPITVMCKAADAQYNVQPETIDSVWNIRGVLCNSWHKVQIVLENVPTKKQRFEFGHAK